MGGRTFRRQGLLSEPEQPGRAVNAQSKILLTRADSQEGTVDYANRDSAAKAGKDYQAVSGTLRFRPGETEKTILVPILGDEVAEKIGRIYITLSNNAGAPIESDAEGRSLTRDTDPLPVLSTSTAPGREGSRTGVAYTVHADRKAEYAYTATADPIIVNGTATSARDFDPADKDIRIPELQTSKTVFCTVHYDNEKELPEFFVIQLAVDTIGRRHNSRASHHRPGFPGHQGLNHRRRPRLRRNRRRLDQQVGPQEAFRGR